MFHVYVFWVGLGWFGFVHGKEGLGWISGFWFLVSWTEKGNGITYGFGWFG